MTPFAWLALLWLSACIAAGQEAGAEEGEEEEEGAEGGAVRWMLLPGGGAGRAQVAVLEGLQPRRAPDPDTVSFLLWTRENPRKAERLRLAAHCAPQPHFRRFRADRPSVLLVHGFGDSAAASYMYPVLRDAFLEVGDYNVLAVDWAALAAAPWYASAAANTRLAAGKVGALLAALARDHAADLSHFHLLGFSLGSHVAGLAAAAAAAQGAGRVGRITGLDPAQVLFGGADASQRLDRSHARRVDVIHTSGGYLAFLTPLGHRDFFPNGGAWPQPGCRLDFAGVCSHRRAYYYYAEALRRPEEFSARACGSWGDFKNGSCEAAPSVSLTALAADGDANDTDTAAGADGDGDFGGPAFYFLDTNPQPPFGRPPPTPSKGGPFGSFPSVLGAP